MTVEVVTVIISAISVLVSVVLFWIDQNRKKKVETLNELDKIFESYHDLPGKDTNKNYHELVSIMSQLDRFAVAVNEGIYIEKIVKERASILFKKMNDEFIKEIAEQRRKQFKRPDYYENTFRLIERIQ